MVGCPECGEDERLRPGATISDGRRETSCEACGYKWLRQPELGWREPATSIRLPRTQPQAPSVASAEGSASYVVVQTKKLDGADIDRRAICRAERYLAMGSPLSRSQLIRLNRLGVLGEDAVQHHLASLGMEVRSIAEDWLAGGKDWGDLSVVARTAQKGTVPRGGSR